jgi:hypothetical protein
MMALQGTARSALWLLASIAGPAFGICPAFPPASVAEKLADPRYQSCDAVAQDYAEFLTDQVALLVLLRPAYQRKLKRIDDQTGEAQAQSRLHQYDEDLRKLPDVAAALNGIPPAAAAAAPSAAASAGARAAARQKLKESRGHSQALSDRIAIGLDEFRPAEMVSYCQQDFVFRVCRELHTKLAACFKGD